MFMFGSSVTYRSASCDGLGAGADSAHEGVEVMRREAPLERLGDMLVVLVEGK
jgi:hypothetical protein